MCCLRGMVTDLFGWEGNDYFGTRISKWPNIDQPSKCLYFILDCHIISYQNMGGQIKDGFIFVNFSTEHILKNILHVVEWYVGLYYIVQMSVANCNYSIACSGYLPCILHNHIYKHIYYMFYLLFYYNLKN